MDFINHSPVRRSTTLDFPRGRKSPLFMNDNSLERPVLRPPCNLLRAMTRIGATRLGVGERRFGRALRTRIRRTLTGIVRPLLSLCSLRSEKHLQLRQRLFGRLLGEEMSPGESLAGHFHGGARLPGGDDVEHPPGVSA